MEGKGKRRQKDVMVKGKWRKKGVGGRDNTIKKRGRREKAAQGKVK